MRDTPFAAKEIRMPSRMSRKSGVNLPSTLERSPGERASRTAVASLKHGFEKVGDRWEAKDHQGPSDARAARGGGAGPAPASCPRGSPARGREQPRARCVTGS
jgi:hypothetical protein